MRDDLIRRGGFTLRQNELRDAAAKAAQHEAKLEQSVEVASRAAAESRARNGTGLTATLRAPLGNSRSPRRRRC